MAMADNNSSTGGTGAPMATQPSSTLLTPPSISVDQSQATTSSSNTITAIGGVKVNESDQLRANFADSSKNITLEESLSLPTKQPISSPLLSSTPPTVSKSLLRAYPYLIIVSKLLGILTWTEDSYISLLLVSTTSIFILYFENIIIYLGHLVIVGLISLFTIVHSNLEKEQELHPTLDDVIHCLTIVSIRSDMLLSPISSLNLTSNDLKRFLFTTIFLSPAYILITYFILPPRTLMICLVLFCLTYHSTWSRVTRKLFWRSKTFRLICFYITGLDFESQHSNKNSLFKIAMNETNKKLTEVTNKAGLKNSGPVRFTYVLYENQRRWLGVGWTPNLLSYERTPWTDEFLNEAESPENFELPQLNSDDSRMYWRWIDKTWRLDLTNDGALQLPSSKSKSTADPKPDDGFIYYDNTWKNPSTEDSFSKYTRKRRWIRTAELISVNSSDVADQQQQKQQSLPTSPVAPVSPIVPTPIVKSGLSDVQSINASGKITSGAELNEGSNNKSTLGSVTAKKRKSLRFDSTPVIHEGSTVKSGDGDVEVPAAKNIIPDQVVDFADGFENEADKNK